MVEIFIFHFLGSLFFVESGLLFKIIVKYQNEKDSVQYFELKVLLNNHNIFKASGECMYGTAPYTHLEIKDLKTKKLANYLIFFR